MKKKIFEYTEDKYHTRYRRDEYGNREQYEECYEYPVKIKTISNVKRYLHNFIDYGLFTLIMTLISLPYFFFYEEQRLIEEYGVRDTLIENLFIVFKHSLFIYYFIGYPILFSITEIVIGKTLSQYFFSTHLINEYLDTPSNKSIILRNLIKIVSLERFFPNTDNSGYHWYEKYSNTYLVDEEEIKRLTEIVDENVENLETNIKQ
ncbi:RDD family protein [Flammeovirga agarivorans]|uniref:RDD domain-containing protein n=1 Tax=Flammeovirga agarivorans TaxID=2726742 RepID=A0A7X8SRQ8_9BACT|nr:hypothetical protein [Flammeovirga agarivorans]NLR95032.1 hypothetical protein [Flammeovirga agarivorans]